MGNPMRSKECPLDQRELELVPLLKGVDFDSIQDILNSSPVKELKEGEVLIRAGEVNEYLYLLLSGCLRVHLDFKMDPVALLEPGEIVGDLSVIDGQPTSAHVVADDDCRLLALSEQNMWSLVKTSHAVAYNFLSILAHRLRKGNTTTLNSRRDATMDALTGLYNRRWLDTMLPRQMDRCKSNGHDLSILLIDINKFKPYNDTYGHLAGDRVLYTVARTLMANVRPGDMIARYGGDEFVALLPDANSARGNEIGERLSEAVSEATGGSDWRDLPSVTISVGLAQMKPEDTPHGLIEAADAQLYSAKKKRR
jgi:diguanylate cyclase (GGDEF)-like protein